MISISLYLTPQMNFIHKVFIKILQHLSCFFFIKCCHTSFFFSCFWNLYSLWDAAAIHLIIVRCFIQYLILNSDKHVSAHFEVLIDKFEIDSHTFFSFSDSNRVYVFFFILYVLNFSFISLDQPSSCSTFNGYYNYNRKGFFSSTL